MQPATFKFFVHHVVLKCMNGTDVILEETWHADQTIPLVLPLIVCMQARIRPAKFQETSPRPLPEPKQITCNGVKLALA